VKEIFIRGEAPPRCALLPWLLPVLRRLPPLPPQVGGLTIGSWVSSPNAYPPLASCRPSSEGHWGDVGAGAPGDLGERADGPGTVGMGTRERCVWEDCAEGFPIGGDLQLFLCFPTPASGRWG
jgi:hypothetical protein